MWGISKEIENSFTYMYTYVCDSMFVVICMCLCVRLYVCICIHVYVCVYVYVCVCEHVYIYNIYSLVNLYIYYIYIYISFWFNLYAAPPRVFFEYAFVTVDGIY